jgi:hypothetical protein
MNLRLNASAKSAACAGPSTVSRDTPFCPKNSGEFLTKSAFREECPFGEPDTVGEFQD